MMTRFRAQIAATLMTCMFTVSCAEHGLTEPGGVRLAPDVNLQVSAGNSVTGEVITTFRSLDGSGGGRVIGADTAEFTTEVRGKSIVAHAKSKSGPYDLSYGVTDAAKNKQGSWKDSAGPSNGKPAKALRISAANGAPPSALELSTNGQTRARTSVTWAKASGGWVTSSRVTTVYDRGLPVASVSVAFIAQRSDRSVFAPGVAAICTVDQLDPSASVDCQTEEAGGTEGFSYGCDSEMNAYSDAVDEYLFASVGLVMCLGGPFACFGAGVVLLSRARAMDQKYNRLIACMG